MKKGQQPSAPSKKLDPSAYSPINIVSPMQNELCTAVIEITEGVNSILNIAELFVGLAHSLPPEDAHHIVEYTNELFEVCIFQDIVVQRLTKVIRILKELDLHIPKENLKKMEALLLNGPQLIETEPCQDEIDSIFEEA